MFILGMLAAFQVLFLPGLLLLKVFDTKRNIVQTLVYSIALSLVANYFLVMLLTLLKIYTPVVVYIIFGLELLVLVWVWRGELRTSLEEIGSNILNAVSEYVLSLNIISKKDDDQKSFINLVKAVITLVFFILAFSSLWWVLKMWSESLGTVFELWDSLVSWNRWAIEWYRGDFPIETWHYPQLIPANWSMIYKFMGSTQIQFFVKGIMPVFTFLILLMLFELGIEKRSVGFFIAVVVTRLMIKKFLFLIMAEGFADLPVSFFTFLAAYTLLKARSIKDKKKLTNALILGAVFSAGAAVAKQSGVYVFGVYPVLAYLLVLKDYQQMNLKKKIQFVLVTQLVLLLLVAPWYIFTEINIINGLNKSEFDVNLVNPYQDITFLERGVEAFLTLEKYAVLYVFLVVMVWFIERDYQWITFALTIPYSLIWAFLLSYSHRNYSIAIPLLGFSVGLGAERLLDFVCQIGKKIKVSRLKEYVLVLVVLIGLLSPAYFLTDDLLLDRQVAEQKKILNADLNKKLYAYFGEEGPYKAILTNYPIRFLPGFEDLQITFAFETYDGYISRLEEYPDLEYMLVIKKADQQILEEIEENIEKGIYELIFEDRQYTLIRIILD